MANPTSKYDPLTEEQFNNRLGMLEKAWVEFVEKYERTEYVGYLTDKHVLYDIITRVDKRKDYYFYFHDIGKDRMSERKEVALIAFWIIKLKPFRMANYFANLYKYTNEMFALHLILSILQYELGREVRTCELGGPLPKKLRDDLLYSFRYQDVSKEALIDIVDCLAER